MRQSDLNKLKNASYLLKCMAHPLRLSLLCALSEHGELSAGGLVELEKNTASQSHVSQYLASLRKFKLVATRRDKQTIYYRLTSKEVKAILKTLAALYCKK